MDVSMSENNEEELPPGNEIEEHMLNLDELNILGMKEDRNILSNLIEGVEIESPCPNVTSVQSPSAEGKLLEAGKSAEPTIDDPNLLEKCTTESDVNKEIVKEVVECNSVSQAEANLDNIIANLDTIIDDGNWSSSPSIPKVMDELGADVVEDGKDRCATEIDSCISTVVPGVSQSGDEVVEMEQDDSLGVIPLDKDNEVLPLDQGKDDEVVSLNQNKDEEVVTLNQDKDDEEVALNKEKDDEDVALNQDKDDEVVALNQDKDDEVVALNQEKDEEVVALDQEKDDEVVALNQEKDDEVVALNQEKDDEVVAQNQDKDDEVVALNQDKDDEVVALNQEKGDEVIASNQNTEKEVLLSEKENADAKEPEAMDIPEGTSVPEGVSAPSVSETVKNTVNEEQPNHVNDDKEEDAIQVINPVVETPRESSQRGRRKRSTSISLLNSSGEQSTPAQDEEDLDDSSTGRPRRKAAKIAGNQIKKIVNNEDDVTEMAGKKQPEIEEWPEGTGHYPRMICFQCCRLRSCQYHLLVNRVSRYMCSPSCFQAFRKAHSNKSTPTTRKESEARAPEIVSCIEVGSGGETKTAPAPVAKKGDKDHIIKCALCYSLLEPLSKNEKKLSWETMEFCNEDCLGKYQDQLGSSCSQCKLPVQKVSMGKYCVRFGYNIKQFCCSTCLEEFKKGLKSCTYCQKDISSGAEGFLAPVGDKGQFKDFCTPACMEKYDHISSGTRPPIKVNACAVCNKPRPVFVELIAGKISKDIPAAAVQQATSVYGLCSEPCFAAFKYVNQLKTDQCESCMRQFDLSLTEEKPATFFYDGGYHCCCKACLNVYILTHRRIVQCNWCRVKKYDFDMIKRVTSSTKVLMMCSLNCLNLFQVSVTAVSSHRLQCDQCRGVSQAQYHLTMSDATVRNFCSYDCVMNFQSRFSRAPLTLPEDAIDSGRSNEADSDNSAFPVISSVQSLAPTDGSVPIDSGVVPTSLTSAQPESINSTSRVTEPINGMAPRQIIVMPPAPRPVMNKMTSCKPTMVSKSVSCQTPLVDSSTQTDETPPIALVPIPIPMYIPMPMHMYCNPYPIPVPFALPMPVPIVIPSTLAYEGIKKKAQVFESVAPEEAEILMMAELVADEEPPKEVEKEADPVEVPSPTEDSENPGQSDNASDSESEGRWKTGDLEEMIAVSSVAGPAYVEEHGEEQPESEGVGRPKRKCSEKPRIISQKSSHNSRKDSKDDDDETTQLKAFLGVNAWSVWVEHKNSELSKVTSSSNTRRLKLFKTDLLQMNLEELNYALCLFVKEVRKPGGDMYAPDTIFYFCLGIQHYLAENGRLDNIFTDLYFERFTECLDQVAMTFPPLTKETTLISTRVLEEHLWESRQLGAHSPYVLLSTLVFFNTKYFHLWTIDDHAKLKFASVVKVKKGRGRPPVETSKAGSSGTRGPNLSALRYTHPDSEEKVFEQHENIETPLRCPVKLYEFYLSKCPEPVRRGGDLFYLLPERACVPDSPVWYSSVALGFDALGKILHRIRMVKELCETYVSEENPS